MKAVLPGIYQWSWFSQEKGYDFNGHFLVAGQEKILVDPPPMTPEDLEWLKKQGPMTCILLTNRDHVREAEHFRSVFSTKILIHEKDAPLIEVKPDGTYRGGDRLPGEWLAIHIPDNKSPGESALFLNRGRGILILGDALIGKPPGELNLMPPDKYADVAKARQGILVLLKYEFDTVLVGDGASVLMGGKQAVERFAKGT